jgi:putative membrane protein
MLAILIFALLLGVLAGTFTGLTPGIHINLIAAILVSLSIPSVEFFIVFIVAMSITHTFIDFIPSIFLGAPDEDTGLSTLPGHEFLLKGQGYYAVKLTVIGSAIAIISLTFLIPFFILVVPKIYPFINRMLGFFLIWILVLLVLTEKNKKLKSLIILLLSAFLGFASLNIHQLSDPLLPLLTGLFGSSTIIYSIKSKTKVPKQKSDKLKIIKKDLIKPTLATIIVSPLCALFPGLGSSQAAIIGSQISGKQNREQFMILLGSINTLIISLSFVILFLLNKSRSGVAASISAVTTLDSSNLKFVLLTIMATTILVIPLTMFLAKIISKSIHKFNYQKISIIILIFLTLVIIYFGGPLGFLVYFTSTFLGLTAIEMDVRKGFLMGSLLIPTIFYYLPI